MVTLRLNVWPNETRVAHRADSQSFETFDLSVCRLNILAIPQVCRQPSRIPHLPFKYQMHSKSLVASSSSSSELSSLALSDIQVYAPCIQALIGTAARFCQVVVDQFATARNSFRGAQGQHQSVWCLRCWREHHPPQPPAPPTLNAKPCRGTSLIRKRPPP